MNSSPLRADQIVLIVEDEPLVALLVEEMLLELGFEKIKINTVTTLPEAIKWASDGTADFVILDLNIQGKETYTVADMLRRRGVPFVFASGAKVGVEYFEVPTLQKPFSLDDIERIVSKYFPAPKG
jgi:CheY-like chemotaxis protein